ncbi:MAG TPA: GNAT family N-acyltransferase [Burkholderiales bacterium]|nr:GNAT family N-acyltransferase [Burkholderiales bacterium]
MTTQILKVEDPELLEQVYRFRYRIYVEQEAMTRDADHERRLLKDDYDPHSISYAVVRDGEVVASLRAIYLEDVPDRRSLVEKFHLVPVLENFRPGEIATTSRFIIDRSLRNGKHIYRLMQLAYTDGRKRGIRLNYGDCSPPLLAFYEHLGYRRYCDGYNDKAFGYKLPLLMLTGDQRFFDEVCSPLARLAREWPDDAVARTWFADRFPAYVSVGAAPHNQHERLPVETVPRS